jgi:hypothetical protein
VTRALRAFGRFWLDFLVGDAPEFLVLTLVVVALAYGLHAHRAIGVVVLPLVTLVGVAASAWRVRRR